jgi:cytochrome d ubiquinol oxidase subunit II
MGLQIFWFIVIAFFWTGFFILEGFDLGVGSLHMLVGRTDLERRVAINSIGPYWDGNEVWLIVAGAAIFAAFPGWYASMFSAMYLAVMLIILALIARGVSFEYRGKVNSPRWRNTWDWSLTIGSLLLPVLLGIALGDLLAGLPINQDGNFTGSFWDLFTPFGVWVGFTLLALSLAHGAMFLSIKTTGVVQERAQRLAGPLSWIAVPFVAGFAIWNHREFGHGVLPGPIEVTAFLLVVAGAWAIREHQHGWGFAATTATIAAVVVAMFSRLYPNVMASSTNSAYNLTVKSTAAGSYALKVMTIVAVIFTPLVIAYQAWTYHTFRARIKGPKAQAAGQPAASQPAAGPSPATTGATGGDGGDGTQPLSSGSQ